MRRSHDDDSRSDTQFDDCSWSAMRSESHSLVNSFSSESRSRVWVRESKHTYSSDSLTYADTMGSRQESAVREVDQDNHWMFCGFEVIPIEDDVCKFGKIAKRNVSHSIDNMTKNDRNRNSDDIGAAHQMTLSTTPSDCSSNIIDVCESPKHLSMTKNIASIKNDCDIDDILIIPNLSIELNDDSLSVISRNSDVPDYLESPKTNALPSREQTCSFFCGDNVPTEDNDIMTKVNQVSSPGNSPKQNKTQNLSTVAKPRKKPLASKSSRDISKTKSSTAENIQYIKHSSTNETHSTERTKPSDMRKSIPRKNSFRTKLTRRSRG